MTLSQVELLEEADDLDAAEELLVKYAGRHRQQAQSAASVWPNALHLLYAFYERHPHPGDDQHKHTEVLEELCTLVHTLLCAIYYSLHRRYHGVAHKSVPFMLYVDRAIGQFQIRLASLTAVKVGHVEHSNAVFNLTTLPCNGRGESSPKLSNCSIYVKHVCSTFLCAILYIAIRRHRSSQVLNRVAEY